MFFKKGNFLKNSDHFGSYLQICASVLVPELPQETKRRIIYDSQLWGYGLTLAVVGLDT